MARTLKVLEVLRLDRYLRAWPAYLLLALAAGLPQSAEGELMDGLQLHLEFEDNVLDSSPNGFHGQAGGDLLYGTGVIGRAAEFDGIDDQVLFPTFEDALISLNDFTLAFWFNIPPGELLSVLSKREICALDPFIDIRSSVTGVMSLEVSSSTKNYFIGTPDAPSAWHHVAFTHTGTDLQAFLDGRLVAMEATDESIDFSNSAILGLSNSPCVGADGTEMLVGLIDDLRIYNRVLTDLEIATLGGTFADGFESGNTSAWSSTVQ